MDSNQPQQQQPGEGQQNLDPQTPHAEFIPPVFRKHSGPGIASFIISLVSLLGYIISVAVAGAMMSPLLEEGITDSPDSNTVLGLGVVGLIFLTIIAANVIGVILGIIGTVIKQRRKIFAVIGLAINAVIVLSIGLFFVYLVASAAV